MIKSKWLKLTSASFSDLRGEGESVCVKITAMAEKRSPMVALLASPGMGHLIPLGEFAKFLALRHGFSVTIFSASFGPSSPAHQAYIDSLPATVTSVLLPPVELHDQPLDALAEILICLTMARSVPNLRHAMRALMATSRLAALVVDIFGTVSFGVASELGLRPYVFCTSTCTALSLMLHLPELDQSIKGEFPDLEEPVRLAGCVAFHGRDLPSPLQDREKEAYGHIVRLSEQYREATGLFVNSFAAMEPGPIGGLKEMEKEKGFPPVFPIGPLIRTGEECGEDRSECLKWLDGQEAGSVVFVCFGSGGVLLSEQLSELAMGLEQSRQRFLWVVRRPSGEGSSPDGSFFTAGGEEGNVYDFLPEGFLRRTESVGMVVPSWAPQAQVLAHPATGGFVSHCGWNSTLESVVHGVPMVAWPLYAEQRMNAVMLSEEIRVALRPKENERGVVEREEVGRVVRELMLGEEGKEVRRRILQLKESGTAALAAGGSSDKALSEVVSEWSNINQLDSNNK